MKKLLWLVFLTYFCVVVKAENSGSYRVLILGDVHYDRADLHKDPDYGKKNKSHIRNLKMWEKATPELLALAGKCADAEHPVFVVQLGDIIQGGAGNRELRRRMLKDGYFAVKAYFPNTPLLLVRGNHDVSASDRSGSDPVDAVAKPSVVDELGVKSYENGCFAIRQGRDLFIAVNGFIPAERIVSFVRKTLDADPDVRFVFFLTHLPILPVSINHPFWLVPGHLEIAELLETRPSLVFAAHTHIPSLAERITGRGRVRQIVVSSMGNTWDPRVTVAPKIGSWEEFVGISKTRRKPGSRTNPMHWPEEETAGKFIFRQLFRNSGFVLLRVDDSGYTVEYCIGEGKSVTLVSHDGSVIKSGDEILPPAVRSKNDSGSVSGQKLNDKGEGEKKMGFYDFTLTSRTGETVKTADLKGKVVLIVNTATGCGFTPQYAPIEQLYRDYHDRGLEILDIPCNQFGGQAPGSDDEIHEFCTVHFNTTFPQMKKSEVNGENRLPLYAFLTSQQGFKGFGEGKMADVLRGHLAKVNPGYEKNDDIKWNFTKFVVDRSGKVVARFEPPAEIAEVEVLIRKLLADGK